MLEIEKKYLLKPLLVDEFISMVRSSAKKEKIIQTYTEIEKEKECRIRKNGFEYSYTQKFGTGEHREEFEEKIERIEFEALFSRRISKQICKKRYVFEENGAKYCIDVFKKDLAGLFILEVEFSDEKMAKNFVLPPIYREFIQQEITSDERYKNKNLSILGIPFEGEINMEKIIERIDKRENGDFDMVLERSIPSYAAIGTVFYLLLSNMKNYRGFLDAKDPEVLHKFRVIGRKIRSILKEIGSIYDDETTANLRSRIGGLTKKTNLARDIDVFIASLPFYLESLGGENEEAINRLKSKLEAEKNQAIALFDQDFCAQLESFCEDFRAVLKFPQMFALDRAYEPVYFVASDAIFVIIEKIILQYENIQKNPANDSFHKLRIYFKRLRYMLESFKSLYGSEKIDKILLKLKTLQDLLGRFWDISTQLEMIKRVDADGEVAALTLLLEGEIETLKEPIMEKVEQFINKKEKLKKAMR